MIGRTVGDGFDADSVDGDAGVVGDVVLPVSVFLVFVFGGVFVGVFVGGVDVVAATLFVKSCRALRSVDCLAVNDVVLVSVSAPRGSMPLIDKHISRL